MSVSGLLSTFRTDLPAEPPEVAAERARVRDFLRTEAAGTMQVTCDSWLAGFDPGFSREIGSRGWIGMTWPVEYGGRALTTARRYAVIEELIAAGAPVAAHWFADRQVGPGLLRNGTPEQRARFLPAMARGELFFSIGMSEPEAGSDLGAVRTRAVPVGDGWTVTGSKIWTSHAHRAHYILALVRTGPPGKPAGALTQMIIDLRAPGVTVRPITSLSGSSKFCEVFFDDVAVPAEDVLGTVGDGWRQVRHELAFERSGPERFLSTFPMLTLAAREHAADRPPPVELGEIVARLSVLRAMSGRVNQQLGAPNPPAVAAAVVKDLGTRLEVETAEWARDWLAEQRPASPELRRLLDEAQLQSPGFTLRGGASEVMRDLIARDLETT
ncbi:acyl-CoA dehydrogenase family protein [Pseudonocardia sp. RS010]|uniref:acyl-CoA dehydrogenase family protein n=1 Tax=Pseudonocardia sp. RS010 TaxID=3385979 RepID=UPI0039A10B7B